MEVAARLLEGAIRSESKGGSSAKDQCGNCGLRVSREPERRLRADPRAGESNCRGLIVKASYTRHERILARRACGRREEWSPA